MIAGSIGPVNVDQLRDAAKDMASIAEQRLRVGYADAHDLIAAVNNAALLLRLAEEFGKAADLLKRAIPKTGEDPQLLRLLSICQLNMGEIDAAVETLRDSQDPENCILLAQLLADRGDVKGGLERALACGDEGLVERLLVVKWRLVGDLALQVGDQGLAAEAAKALRERADDVIAARLLEIRAERSKPGFDDDDAIKRALLELVADSAAELDALDRYFLALALFNEHLADEASRLLEDQVDLSRPNPSAHLYLRALAEARRDAEFHRAIAKAPVELREDAGTQWVVATHAWNLGDLNASLKCVERILKLEPGQPKATLLKIEIFIRQGRTVELHGELSKPIENLPRKGSQDLYRIATLLMHFGYPDRAAALAYRLFIEQRDDLRAWLTFFKIVLEEGSGAPEEDRRWKVERVEENTAVDLEYDDGETKFIVLEPDASLRRIDVESWEVEHATCKALLGLKRDERFRAPDGREGVVANVRHKYVARLHYILENQEARFPQSVAIRKIQVDPEAANGLDDLIAQAKSRHELVAAEEAEYRGGNLPIAMLAQRVGVDVIDVAQGLAAHGQKLRVALGNAEERVAANSAIFRNGRRGCVLDTLTYWTAYRLGALEAIEAMVGKVHVPQSVVDALRRKIDQLQIGVTAGLMSAGYSNGQLTLRETSAEVVANHVGELEGALAWLEHEAAVSPVVASDSLPAALRDTLRSGKTDICDSVVLSIQGRILLVSDDLMIRRFAAAFGVEGSVWLHHLFGAALDRREIDLEKHVRWSADLISANQSYISLTGAALAKAAELDETAPPPGPLFRQVSSIIGGAEAEMRSHIEATLECLQELWTRGKHAQYREAVTSHLLTQLVNQRPDFHQALKAILGRVRWSPTLAGHIQGWIKGHFLSV